jgi:hypothetical protein
MAASVKQKVRPPSPNLVYTEARSQIRTGDVLLFQGTGWMSRVIQWGSGSAYSHAGFAAWWGTRLLVFQATGRGAEVLPASSAVDTYDGQVDWYALRERSAINSEQLLTNAVTMLGRAYAHTELLDLMWRMLRQTSLRRPDPRTSPDHVFCSQYVSYCYRTSGLDLVDLADDGSTSPADLARSPYLELRGVLHANQADKKFREVTIPGRARKQRVK